MSNATFSATAISAYKSETDRDERIIAVKISEKISLSAASKLVTAIAKDRGEGTVNRRGIIDNMYDFLQAERRSFEDLKKWCEENGTENTVRYVKAHDRVRVLVNKIFDKHEAALKAVSQPGPKPEAPKAAPKSRRSNKAAA